MRLSASCTPGPKLTARDHPPHARHAKKATLGYRTRPRWPLVDSSVTGVGRLNPWCRPGLMAVSGPCHQIVTPRIRNRVRPPCGPARHPPCRPPPVTTLPCHGRCVHMVNASSAPPRTAPAPSHGAPPTVRAGHRGAPLGASTGPPRPAPPRATGTSRRMGWVVRRTGGCGGWSGGRGGAVAGPADGSGGQAGPTVAARPAPGSRRHRARPREADVTAPGPGPRAVHRTATPRAGTGSQQKTAGHQGDLRCRGADCRVRTDDLRFTRAVLYQLS